MNMKARLGDYIQEYSVKNKKDEDIPVYSVTNTQGFCRDYFGKEVASKDKTTYKIVPKGCFAYNPSRINVGSVDWQRYEEKVIVSPLYNVFSVSDQLDCQYLYYYLKSNVALQRIRAVATGSVRDNLRFEMLSEFPINLPSLNDQKDIVKKLDGLKNAMKLREEQLAKLDELVKARFVEMFGNQELGEAKYSTKKLGDLSNKISDGVHAKPVYTESGRPFLSVVNINKGIVDFTDCKFVSEDAYQKMIKSTNPEKGDVLYTKVGATYGIPAYVDSETEFCLYVSVCLIKPKHEAINSRFLSIQMGMPSVKHQADARIKGIGVPDLHLNQIREFDIICPPRELQDKFVAYVEQVDKSKVVVQKSIDETQIFFNSLIQEYFG